MKRIQFVFSVLLLAAVLLLGAFAAENTVYVAEDAKGSGTSATDAVGTIEEALALLDGEGGRIVLCSAVFVWDGIYIPEQSGDLTITAEGRGMIALFDGDIVLEKNTNANVVTLDAPIRASKELTVYGGFNSVVFGENFAVDGTVDFYGGMDVATAPSSNASNADAKSAQNKEFVTELAYSITVNAGDFRNFSGGNRRDGSSDFIGSIAAPITVTVNGGSFGTGVSFAADSALKNDRAFSVSGNSILADDATLTVNGGVFNAPVYAQGYLGEANSVASGSSQYVNSDAKYYAIDGDIVITLNGGTFNGCEISAFQATAGLTQLLRGNFTLTIADAAELADGVLLDATQVKAYNGVTDKKATLNYAGNATAIRFDVVNGVEQTYEEPLRIACIGDSITQGTGTTYVSVYPATYPQAVAQPAETHSYPAQLLQKIFAEGNTDVILGNYGHGGAKVMDYSDLGYHDLFFYKLSKYECDADYYIIGLGINDARSTSYTYGMCARFEREYKAFIAEYAELSDTVTVFATSALYAPNVDVGNAAVRAMQRNALAELKAEGKKVTFVDLYALTLEDAFHGKLLSGDKLHPNSDGYTTYANAIYNAVFNGVTEVENFEMEHIYVAADGKEDASGTADDPMSMIGVAFAKAAPTATVHIIGTYNYDRISDARFGFQTPMHREHITLVGEGEDAKLIINSNHLHIKGDMLFDNLTLTSSENETVIIACGYNNVAFTETFKTNKGRLLAGVVALDENKASSWYNSRESISSDKDCTITVNGGTYEYFLCGNCLFTGYKPAIYGTYSGDMVVNIGPNVVLNGMGIKGASGQNYLTGTVTLNAASWASGLVIRPFPDTGNVNEKYVAAKNTGKVTVNVLEPCTAKTYAVGDLNTDGSVDIADVLIMLGYVLNGPSADFKNSDAPYYYGVTDLTLRDALHMLWLATR